MSQDTNELSEQAKEVKAYHDADIKFDDLSEKSQTMLREDKGQGIYDEINSFEDSTPKTEEQKPEVIPEQTPNQNAIEEIPQDRARNFKKDAQARADELNAYKMRQGAHEHKMKTDLDYRDTFLKKEYGFNVPEKQVVNLKTDEESIFDEDNQRAHIDETTALRKKLDRLEASIATKEANEKLYDANQTAYKNIEAFVSVNPHLATTASINSIDSIYSSLYSAGKTQEQLNQDVIAQGVSPKDLEVYSKIMAVHEKVSSGLYPNYRSAYRDSDDYETPSQLPTETTTIDQVRQQEEARKMEQINQQPRIDVATSGENDMGTEPGKRAQEEFKAINSRYKGDISLMPSDVAKQFREARRVLLRDSELY